MPTSVEKPSTSEPSPLLPTRWTPNAFAWPRSLAFLCVLVAAFFAGQALNAFIAFSLLHTTRADALSNHLTWGIVVGQFAAYLPILVALIWGLPWLAQRSLHDLGLRGFSARTIAVGLIGMLAMYAVTIGVAGIQYAFTHQKPEETAISLFTSSHDAALITSFTLLATVAAPFMEEFIFRGFLFNALLRYMPVWSAAVLSGIVFGAVHGSPSAFLPLAGSGIVLAYVYYRSGSLTAAMVTHSLFNLVNVALLALGKT
jgi:membrane protease YdiL (CAAX protease family)